MIVGFDVSQTGRFKAGCGYFADSLIRHLVALNELDQYVLYPAFGGDVWDPEWRTRTVNLRHKRVRRAPGPRTLADLEQFWLHPPADLEDTHLGQPDVVHANNFFCPPRMRHARLVYTLHDLAFVVHPEWTTEENRHICFTGVFGASVRADHVIAVSRASRDQFLDVFPHFPAERISVVYQASRYTDSGPQPRRPGRLANLQADGFWLSVGTIEPRKNYARLVRAYARYRAQVGAAALPLVIAGGTGWLMDDFLRDVECLGLAGQVVLAGYVPDAELRWLYEHCFGFVYPSLFEGFGLPVIEAMSLGAAVVSSNATSLPEVVGEAGLLVDPLDEAEIAAALVRLARDGAGRAALRQRAYTRAREFSWSRAAQQVHAIYMDVLGRPKR